MYKEKAEFLARKLESRGYRQAHSRLRTSEREFCCLGVACQISKKAKCLKIKENNTYLYDEEKFSLPDTVKEYFGFHDRDGRRRDGKSIVIDGRSYESLVSANDGIVIDYGVEIATRYIVPFKKIAAYIRENHEFL